MLLKTEFIKFEDKLYIVKKVVKAEYNPNIEAWKLWTGADIALRREDLIYFVELIPDLEIVEELK